MWWLINVVLLGWWVGQTYNAAIPFPAAIADQRCCEKNTWTTGNNIKPSNLTQNGTVCCRIWRTNRYGGGLCDNYGQLDTVYIALRGYRWLIMIVLLVLTPIPWRHYRQFRRKDNWNRPLMYDIVSSLLVIAAPIVFLMACIIVFHGNNLTCKIPGQTTTTTATLTIIHHAPYDFVLLVIPLIVVLGGIAMFTLWAGGQSIGLYIQHWNSPTIDQRPARHPARRPARRPDPVIVAAVEQEEREIEEVTEAMTDPDPWRFAPWRSSDDKDDAPDPSAPPAPPPYSGPMESCV